VAPDRLYHFTSVCTDGHYHPTCAQALHGLTPSRPGLRVTFVNEWFSRGRWRSHEYTFRLTKRRQLKIWHYY
jgi:hypothetical protein